MGLDQSYSLGHFRFHCGKELADAQINYQLFGELNSDCSNLILYPSAYGAWSEDMQWLVGPIFDSNRWCVLLVNQFGNGRSSSPSNSAMGLVEQGWLLSHVDNVRAQKQLLRHLFGETRPALIYGWSMGAQQVYHWGALEPEYCSRLCCLCGTARTSAHNRLFLLSLRQALTADPAWDGTAFRGKPEQGLRTFALIYASWAVSQTFYRQDIHGQLGYSSVEDYVERSWLPAYQRHDPHDLIAMLDCWLANDLAKATGHGSDLSAALAQIQAKTLVMAGRHDLYFPPADLAHEASFLSRGSFELLDSVWGHRAGNPRDDPEQQAQIRELLSGLMAEPPV